MTAAALVVGKALTDVVMCEGRPVGEHCSGSRLNVTVGLARLGRNWTSRPGSAATIVAVELSDTYSRGRVTSRQ